MSDCAVNELTNVLLLTIFWAETVDDQMFGFASPVFKRFQPSHKPKQRVSNITFLNGSHRQKITPQTDNSLHCIYYKYKLR